MKTLFLQSLSGSIMLLFIPVAGPAASGLCGIFSASIAAAAGDMREGVGGFEYSCSMAFISWQEEEDFYPYFR